MSGTDRVMYAMDYPYKRIILVHMLPRAVPRLYA
jgi:hypothetical protein